VRFNDFDQFGPVYQLDLRWVIHGFRIFDLTFYLPPCSKFVLGLKVKKKKKVGIWNVKAGPKSPASLIQKMGGKID
jgi:hypothetical protein